MLLHRLILYAQVQGHQMHMYNFHVHRKEVVEHQSMEYKGLRFHSPRGLRIFSLSHDCYKTKHLSLFVYRGQKLSFFNSGEHRRCHQVWSNTFESKGMKFLLIELNEPIN